LPKIAIIDQCVSAGGVERFLHGLISGMIELPEFKQWDVTVLINRYNTAGKEVKWPDHLKSSNMKVRYIFDDLRCNIFAGFLRPGRIMGIPGTGPIRWEIFLMMAKYWIEHECKREEYDVVYFAYPYLLMCPKIKMPMVATPHDFNWKHKELNSASFLGRLLLNLLTPGWLRRCNKIVVSSEFIASEIGKYYPSEISKVNIVRLGIPADVREPDKTEIDEYKHRRGIPLKFILSVGWILPHKNQKVIIEALYLLRKKGIEIPAIFTGPNSDLLRPDSSGLKQKYLIELIHFAEKLGLKYGQDYIGLGYVTDHELDCLYRLSTALIAPALYEAGSFPILEAVKSSCPVICSNIMPYREQDKLLGNNLNLFNPNDSNDLANKIENVLKNIVLAKEKASKAAKLMEQYYSWRGAAKGYVSVFNNAMKQG